MEPARSTWTDQRLDDFRRAVDERFDRVDERFNRIDDRFNHVDNELGALGSRIDAQTARIDALQRTLLQVGVAQIVTFFAALVTLVLKTP